MRKAVLLVTLLLAGCAIMYFLQKRFLGLYSQTNWQQGVWFIIGLSCWLVFFAEVAVGLLQVKGEKRSRVRLVYTSVIVVLFVAEPMLRWFEVNRDYVENRGNGYYFSAFNEGGTSLQRNYTPGNPHDLISNEFHYTRTVNADGYADADFYAKADSSSVLIQTYGDSFTEGDGAPADSSYPAILRTLLGPRFIVQNMGVCGNDPGFYVNQLKYTGLKYKPDLVVFVYGSGDFNGDFITRGGLERFKGDYWRARAGKSWEWAYASSYVARLFIKAFTGADSGYFLYNEEEFEQQKEQLKPKWNEVFTELDKLTSENGIKVLLLKRVERSEVDENAYMQDFLFFNPLVKNFKGWKHAELMEYYRDSIKMLDKTVSDKYYWPNDGHHNPTGYRVMAMGVHHYLKKHYPELFVIDTAGVAE